MPRKEYRLPDKIKGEVVFKEGAIGDFVIMRSNGQPIYNFAVVADDVSMEISHVLRGDDHLSIP
jgi:nondiscriminating glutamyl-tRNA synthetase